jgi:hypothetical protein
MYLSALSVLIPTVILINIYNDIDSNSAFKIYLISLIISFVFLLIALGICLIQFIFSALNVAQKTAKPYKFTMIIKLICMPYFILNIITCGIALLPTATIFLFWGMPIIIGIDFCCSYMLMVANGSENISYLIKEFGTTRDSRYIIYIILHFLFIIDVATAIVLFVKERDKTASSD